MREHIRDVPDFPKPGIQFKDITPLIKQPDLLREAITEMIRPFRDTGLTAVTGMEARGFIFGSIAAQLLEVRGTQ